MQIARGPMEYVCGKGEIWWLKCWEAEMKRSSRGGGFGLPNQKPMCADSVSVWCMQIARGDMEDVSGKGEIWWLKCWGAEMKRSSRGGGFGLQNQKLMCMDSVLFQCMQTAKGATEEVCGGEGVWWLKW